MISCLSQSVIRLIAHKTCTSHFEGKMKSPEEQKKEERNIKAELSYYSLDEMLLESYNPSSDNDLGVYLVLVLGYVVITHTQKGCIAPLSNPNSELKHRRIGKRERAPFDDD